MAGGALEEFTADLEALDVQHPGLLTRNVKPPGMHVDTSRRAAVCAALQFLAPARCTALHQLAAAHYANCQEGMSHDEVRAAQNEELYHLWMAGSQERGPRLDALFRERRHARDTAGCEALFDAVVDAGGEGDPLLILCRGIMSSEMLRDWGAAEAYFQKVLEHQHLVPSLQARARMNLGLLDRYQGRYGAALRHLAESCRIAEEAGDWLTLANGLMNRGNTCAQGYMQGHLAAGALDDALGFHAQSRNILHLRGQTDLELRAWNNMGAVYKIMGRLDDALAAYRTALSLTPLTQKFMRAMLTNNIAEVEEAQGEWDKAQQAYELALAIYREIDDNYEVADALLNLGSVQERLGLVDEATESYREAIAAIESVRGRLKAEEARAGFLGTRLGAYERLTALSLTRPGGESLAFETVERAKARAFIELLADRPLRPPQTVPKSLLEREHALRRALDHLYKMGAQPSGQAPAGNRTAALEAELEEIYRRMRRLDAEYAGSRTVDPLSLNEVQARLPIGAALVEYFEARNELGCFVVTRSSARGMMLPGAAASLRSHLQTADADAATPDTYELSSRVVAPIEPLVADYEDVFLVPHGLLHYVPLHALGSGGPLLERHRVVYAPSASILLRDRGGQPVEGGDRRPGFLSLGCNGANLHYAELEAQHVARLAGARAYVGRQASSEVLHREGHAYGTLHLACHGTFNAQAPLASGLMLADGKLDAMTILQTLRLHADLVVMSACDTGRAAVLRGDELMGLARAILYAGADSVLVSLWPVDDLATALLMDAFYRARSVLSGGASDTAEALRQAQLALRSMTAKEALAATTRLAAKARSIGEDMPGGTNLSPATPHPVIGEVSAPRVAGRARGAVPPAAATALGDTQTPWARPGWASGEGPYAHPYYWAAFALICGGIPAA